MNLDLAHEEEQLDDMKHRWLELKALAEQLASDKRWLSSSLTQDDPLVTAAKSRKVSLARPLTIGTLLAGVLAETDSVECAIRCADRRLHPKASSPQSPMALR
jgi:hypothetical protein